MRQLSALGWGALGREEKHLECLLAVPQSSQQALEGQGFGVYYKSAINQISVSLRLGLSFVSELV